MTNRTYLGATVLATVMLLSGATAHALWFTQTLDIYQIISSDTTDAYEHTVAWGHTYTLGYQVLSAHITITAEDVDAPMNCDNEDIRFIFLFFPVGSLNDQGFHSPGPVTDINPGPGANPPLTGLSTTTFQLPPEWILPIGFYGATAVSQNSWAEIETSTLHVEYAVPEPSTLLLLSLGLGGVIGLHVRRMRRR